jgi:hypothetical protein
MNSSIHSASASKSKGEWPRPLVIHTTLYDLCTAINAEVGADEDDLAIAVVVHLLATHRLTYLGSSKRRRPVTGERRLLPRRRKAVSTLHSGEVARRACRALPYRA